MLDRFYEKHFLWIVNALGFFIFLSGVVMLVLNGFYQGNSIIEFIIYGINFMVFLMMVVGGFLLFHNQSKLSWILVISNISFCIAWNIYLILFYCQLLFFTDSTFEMILSFSFDPYVEIQNCLHRCLFLLIPIAVFHNKIFIKNFKIHIRDALLSTLSGVLLFCVLMILESFAEENNYMNFY